MGVDRERGERGDLVGPAERGVEVAHPLHEAQRRRALGVDRLGRQEHRPRRGATKQGGRPAHGPTVDGEPEAGGRDAEPAARAGDAHVAGEGELHAGTEGRPVDGGDRHGPGRGEAVEHGRQGVREPLVLDPGQIGARTERTTLAGEHDGARSPGQGVLEPGRQRHERGVVDGIATLGTGDGEHEHVLVPGDLNRHLTTFPAAERLRRHQGRRLPSGRL